MVLQMSELETTISSTIPAGPIGIMVSGGADSALLLYILMKHATDTIHVFACGNGDTNHQESKRAGLVVNWCSAKTGNTKVVLHAYDVDHKTAPTVLPKDVVDSSGITCLYFGLSRPPVAGVITDVDIEGSAANGSVDADPAAVLPSVYTSKADLAHIGLEPLNYSGPIYIPFVNTTKQGLAALYTELALEELFPITRSCESRTVIDDHCGKCWWCKERVWAFGKLV